MSQENKPSEAAEGQPGGLDQVKNILAVSSCKGGVGKSTIATNLAFALNASGLKTGILDADIFGPSLPTIIRIEETDLFHRNGLVAPLEHDGVKMMSFGWVPKGPGEGAAIMRGPMVSQVLNQMLMGMDWGELDILVIDLPPGTGDTQLTLLQSVSVTAALIITTPQELSFIDVTKGIEMFSKLEVPTLGVVENMSYFVCDNCSTRHYPFSRGAMRKLVEQYGFQTSFEIPMHADISQTCDQGVPMVLAEPKHEISICFSEMAQRIVEELKNLSTGLNRPTVSYAWDQGILLEYSDGTEYALAPAALRRACRCALCIDEMSGKPLLNPEKVPEDIYPTSIKPMGNYAVGVNWSDEHTSSIYPYKALLELAKKADAT